MRMKWAEQGGSRRGPWLGLLVAVGALLIAAAPASAACDDATSQGVKFEVCGTDVSAFAGHAFSGEVATYSFTGTLSQYAEAKSATITWGDGTHSAGTISGSKVLGTHTYTTAGQDPTSVEVSAGQVGSSDVAGSVTGTAVATIVDPPQCGGKPATIFRGSGYSGTDGEPGTPIVVTGTPGPDVIVGDSANDEIHGEGGDDTICGGDGPDVIFDGTGNDTVDGEGGNDTLLAQPGNDTMVGGAGTDRVSYRLSARGVVVTLGTSANGDTAHGENDTIDADVEDLRGSARADVLTGDGEANLIIGDRGNDTISGGAGNDHIYDGSGDDSVSGGEGDDGFSAGAGKDSLTGDGGQDLISYHLRSGPVIATLGGSEDSGTAGEQDTLSAERLRGTAQGDTLTGDDDANRIYGEGGTDKIDGKGGNDILSDGEGGYVLDEQVSGGPGDDLIIAGKGSDVYSGGDGVDRVSYEKRTGSVIANINDNGAFSGETGESASSFGDKILTDVEKLQGGSGGDFLGASPTGSTLLGGLGDDTLNGAYGGQNVVLGGPGADTMHGGDYTDMLSGGGGDDTIADGGGADELLGGDDDDTLNLTYDALADHGSCGAGDNDTANSTDGQDVIDTDCETRPG